MITTIKPRSPTVRSWKRVLKLSLVALISVSGSLWLLALLLFAFAYDSGLNRSNWEVSDFPGRSDVTLTTHDKGTVLRVGQSSIHRQTNGSVMTYDHSGKGAVLCTYGIFGHFRRVLTECGEPRYAELVDFLDLYRSEIRGFIALNNWKPATRFQVEVVMGLEDALRTGYMNWYGEPAGAFCPPKRDWQHHWAEGMLAKGRDEWIAMMKDDLSVPRPPASNPCL